MWRTPARSPSDTKEHSHLLKTGPGRETLHLHISSTVGLHQNSLAPDDHLLIDDPNDQRWNVPLPHKPERRPPPSLQPGSLWLVTTE